MLSHLPIFPFTAIVGQDDLKLALLLNAVNPAIGGVLIRGEKGTGKSTAVRALAGLLPDMEVVAGCLYGCHPKGIDGLCDDCQNRKVADNGLPVARRSVPVVTLPLGATEDRVLGALDLEAALHEGRKRFEPGLLARAHRGILYIDEVNLLEDHLVDILLDVAASGVNVVERESVSFSHPARFLLVGTMNPEEGELRPQLLDRFGICVEVKGIPDPAARAKIVRQRLAFEADPKGFLAAQQKSEAELKQPAGTGPGDTPPGAGGRGGNGFGRASGPGPEDRGPPGGSHHHPGRLHPGRPGRANGHQPVRRQTRGCPGPAPPHGQSPG